MPRTSQSIWWSATAALLLVEGGAFAWREFQQRATSAETFGQIMEFQVPDDMPGAYEQKEIDPRQSTGLSYRRGSRFVVNLAAGRMETLFLQFLNEGNSRYFEDLMRHPPTACMSHAGYEVVREYPMRYWEIGDEIVRVQSIGVRSPEGAQAFIFKGIWIHSAFPIDLRRDPHRDHASRLRASFSGLSTPPACVLMGGVSGTSNENAAWEVFRSHALRHLTLVPLGSAGA